MALQIGTLSWGDLAAREVSARFGGAVATTTELSALPVGALSDKQVWAVTADNSLWIFVLGSTVTVGGGVLTHASGRFFAVGSGGVAGSVGAPVRFVKMATATTLAANTRTGNVLLADANGALGTIDGVTPVAGDRVLVKDEATGANNGIYVIDSLGGASAKWQMTRASDFDGSTEVLPGTLVVVDQGTANADRVFALTTNAPITVNTTGLTFVDLLKQQIDNLHGAAGAALTDADATIQVGSGKWRVLPGSTLSTGRTLTLGTTGAAAGDQITITRIDASANTYAIANGGAGAGTLVTLPASKVNFAKCQFDGTNWALREVGTQ